MKQAATRLADAQARQDGYFETNIPGLIVMRSSVETRPQCILYQPALCLIVQGAKEIAGGGSNVRYQEGQSLIITADMPTLGHVTEASTKRPYIGLGLTLDIGVIRTVAEELGISLGANLNCPFELFVEDTSDMIVDCVVRLMNLEKKPDAVRILLPGIMREICFWLLTGPNGVRIAKQVSASAAATRIAVAVQSLKETFRASIKIADLASSANMSPSSFFHHFRAATSLTPLQFQKQLRLTEARRLMLGGSTSVAQAAALVGYESPSQFSREYRRMFGLPPARDTSFFSVKTI